MYFESCYFSGFVELFNILVFGIPIFGVFLGLYSNTRIVYFYLFCSYFCSVLIYFWYYFYFFFPFSIDFGFVLFRNVDISNCFFDIDFSFRVDVFSVLFIILSSFLVLICSLVNWNLYYRLREFYFLLTFCLVLFILVFCISNLFIFYILFEVLLLPFYWFIGS